MKFTQQLFFPKILLKFHVLAEQNYILQTCVIQSIHPYELSALLADEEDWSSSSLVKGPWQWKEVNMEVRINTDVD